LGFDPFAPDPFAPADLADADFVVAEPFFAFGAADFAFGRFPDSLAFDPEEVRVSFTPLIALDPTLATASAPSAIAAPIERTTPPAGRFTPRVDRFADFAVAPAASVLVLVVPLDPPLLLLPWLMGTSRHRDSVPNARNFVICLEPADGHPPRARFRTQDSSEVSAILMPTHLGVKGQHED
jgi:hypothetical protein